MLISVVNHTHGTLSDEEVQNGIRAVNRQIAYDFKPHWHMSAELRLEGAVGDAPDDLNLPELRGDAIIYLWDDVDLEGALGYHHTHASGVPFGFVFTKLAKELGESWTVTLSHEALELVADPEVNLLVAGPHPSKPAEQVFHWYEMCDAVQDETYKVDGIDVSNFLLPLYFTSDAEEGGRNDFLGRKPKGTRTKPGSPLRSFGINPGGYIGFFNPKTGKHETYSRKEDERARERLNIKDRAKIARRSTRHRSGIGFRDELNAFLKEDTGVRRAAVSAGGGERTTRRAAMDVVQIASEDERSE